MIGSHLKGSCENEELGVSLIGQMESRPTD